MALVVAILLLAMSKPCYTQTFTLMNAYESTVSLNPKIWKPFGKLHFKMISSGEDGTVFTIVNKKDNKMMLQISRGKYKLKFDGMHHNIPGLTNVKVHSETWNEVKVEQIGPNLKLHVDHVTVMLPLSRRRHWLADNWKDISFGLKNEENDLNSAKSIIGCIELGSFHNSTILDDYAKHVHAISNRCIDACAIQSCDHGGKCINRFNHAVCDCRETGYKGPTCEDEAIAFKLNGTSFMTFNMEETSTINKDIGNEIRMRFKTKIQEGLLLSMETDNGFLMIELYNSSIHIVSTLAEGIFHMNIGENLHDNQWHHFQLSRKLNYIETRLDDDMNIKAIVDDKNDHVTFKVRKILKINFGGVSDLHWNNQLKSKHNFHGCLQQIYLDNHDIIDKVLHGNDLSFTKEGDITSCNNIPSS